VLHCWIKRGQHQLNTPVNEQFRARRYYLKSSPEVGIELLTEGWGYAIGIAFVARFAYVTSDTPTDGAATAFLFAMVASGAFLGPAIAIAVGNRGHKAAAGFWWLLAALAILANWTPYARSYRTKRCWYRG
jgi:hypothetical protein